MFHVPERDIPKLLCLLPFIVIYLVATTVWEAITNFFGSIRAYFRNQDE